MAVSLFFSSFAPMNRTILTITGSDGTGGSGVQADIRLISKLGGTAASAITSITVQNTLGIQEFHDLPASVVRQQVEAIINDLEPQIVKIGLIRRTDVVEMLAEVLQRHKPRHIIYVPVLTSSKGEQLVDRRVYQAIEKLLIPMCTVVLAPSDLAETPLRHGRANQLASALAYYLSLDEKVSDAMLHAQTYLKQLPADYADGNSRSDELYNQFLDADRKGELMVPKGDFQMEDAPTPDPELIREKAFLTESLAKVYVKQGKYEQALAIFLDLNLKFSKKNTYFADQIRYLEKVIELKKSNKN